MCVECLHHEFAENQVITGICLFCRGPLERVIRPEHIVPDAISGWLTVYDVCNHCNHQLGRDVDKVVSSLPMLALRREAGLVVPKGVRLEPVDGDIDVYGPWSLDKDGVVRRGRDVVVEGNSISVLGDTLEEAWQKGDQLNARRERRGEARIEFGEADQVEFGVRRYLYRPTKDELEAFNSLMLREAAKAAIEYISIVSNPAVALLPSLDAIRSCALSGARCDELAGGVDYIGPSLSWLPRVGAFDGVAVNAEERLALADLEHAIERDANEDWEPPASFPRPTQLFHELRARGNR